MNPQTALIIDDHCLFAELLEQVLRQHGGYSMVLQGGSRAELLALTRAHRPGLIMLDLTLRDGDAQEILPEVHALSPETRIVVCTGAELPAVAVGSEVAAVVPKTCGAAELLRVIDEVNPIKRVPGERLTPREREVLRAITGGLSSKEAASLLGISTATVELHKRGLFRKFGVHSATALFRAAMDAGLCGVTSPFEEARRP